jgi:hypothetical protein
MKKRERERERERGGEKVEREGRERERERGAWEGGEQGHARVRVWGVHLRVCGVRSHGVTHRMLCRDLPPSINNMMEL